MKTNFKEFNEDIYIPKEPNYLKKYDFKPTLDEVEEIEGDLSEWINNHKNYKRNFNFDEEEFFIMTIDLIKDDNNKYKWFATLGNELKLMKYPTTKEYYISSKDIYIKTDYFKLIFDINKDSGTLRASDINIVKYNPYSEKTIFIRPKDY